MRYINHLKDLNNTFVRRMGQYDKGERVSVPHPLETTPRQTLRNLVRPPFKTTQDKLWDRWSETELLGKEVARSL